MNGVSPGLDDSPDPQGSGPTVTSSLWLGRVGPESDFESESPTQPEIRSRRSDTQGSIAGEPEDPIMNGAKTRPGPTITFTAAAPAGPGPRPWSCPAVRVHSEAQAG